MTASFGRGGLRDSVKSPSRPSLVVYRKGRTGALSRRRPVRTDRVFLLTFGADFQKIDILPGPCDFIVREEACVAQAACFRSSPVVTTPFPNNY